MRGAGGKPSRFPKSVLCAPGSPRTLVDENALVRRRSAYQRMLFRLSSLLTVYTINKFLSVMRMQRSRRRGDLAATPPDPVGPKNPQSGGCERRRKKKGGKVNERAVRPTYDERSRERKKKRGGGRKTKKRNTVWSASESSRGEISTELR